MKDDTQNSPIQPIINVFSRYNLVIFIVVIVGGLSVSVLTLTNILGIPYTPKTSNSNTNTTITIDESTLQRVNLLNKSANNKTSQTTNITRTSLFSE